MSTFLYAPWSFGVRVIWKAMSYLDLPSKRSEKPVHQILIVIVCLQKIFPADFFSSLSEKNKRPIWQMEKTVQIANF